MNPEIIGTVAAIFITASYIPQMIKILRDKDTKSLSLGMYLLLSGGISLWLVFGVMIESPSLVIMNAVTLCLVLVILFMKIRHG